MRQNLDRQINSSRRRGRLLLVKQAEKLQRRIRELEEERRLLSATLTLMADGAPMVNRRVQGDFEYATVRIPFLIPKGWRVADRDLGLLIPLMVNEEYIKISVFRPKEG